MRQDPKHPTCLPGGPENSNQKIQSKISGTLKLKKLHINKREKQKEFEKFYETLYTQSTMFEPVKVKEFQGQLDNYSLAMLLMPWLPSQPSAL